MTITYTCEFCGRQFVDDQWLPAVWGDRRYHTIIKFSNGDCLCDDCRLLGIRFNNTVPFRETCCLCGKTLDEDRDILIVNKRRQFIGYCEECEDSNKTKIGQGMLKND